MHYKCLRGGGTRRAARRVRLQTDPRAANPPERRTALRRSRFRASPLLRPRLFFPFSIRSYVRRTCSFSIQKYTLNFTDHTTNLEAPGATGATSAPSSEASSGSAASVASCSRKDACTPAIPKHPPPALCPGCVGSETVRPPAPTAAMGGPSPGTRTGTTPPGTPPPPPPPPPPSWRLPRGRAGAPPPPWSVNLPKPGEARARRRAASTSGPSPLGCRGAVTRRSVPAARRRLRRPGVAGAALQLQRQQRAVRACRLVHAPPPSGEPRLSTQHRGERRVLASAWRRDHRRRALKVAVLDGDVHLQRRPEPAAGRRRRRRRDRAGGDAADGYNPSAGFDAAFAVVLPE